MLKIILHNDLNVSSNLLKKCILKYTISKYIDTVEVSIVHFPRKMYYFEFLLNTEPHAFFWHESVKNFSILEPLPTIMKALKQAIKYNRP